MKYPNNKPFGIQEKPTHKGQIVHNFQGRELIVDCIEPNRALKIINAWVIDSIRDEYLFVYYSWY